MRTFVQTTAALLILNLAAACSNWPGFDAPFWRSSAGKDEQSRKSGVEQMPPISRVYFKVAKMALKHGHVESARLFVDKGEKFVPQMAQDRTVSALDPLDHSVDEQQNVPTDGRVGGEITVHDLPIVHIFSTVGLVHLTEPAEDGSQNRISVNRTAVLYDFWGAHKFAQRTYREALKDDPENLSLRHNLAISLAMSGAYRQSVREMSQVTASTKATIQHRQALALLLQLDPRIEKSIDRLHEPEKVDRDDDQLLPVGLQALENRAGPPRYVSAAEPVSPMDTPAGAAEGDDGERTHLAASDMETGAKQGPMDYLAQTASKFWDRLRTSF